MQYSLVSPYEVNSDCSWEDEHKGSLGWISCCGGGGGGREREPLQGQYNEHTNSLEDSADLFIYFLLSFTQELLACGC